MGILERIAEEQRQRDAEFEAYTSYVMKVRAITPRIHKKPDVERCVCIGCEGEAKFIRFASTIRTYCESHAPIRSVPIKALEDFRLPIRKIDSNGNIEFQW